MKLLTVIVFALLGGVLAAAGGWLAVLGGSWYYLIAGLVLLMTAWLIRTRNPLATWVYAALMVGTLGWALWEVGFDWWQLAPRGGIIVILGLLLLVPTARGADRRGFAPNSPAPIRSGPPALPVAVSSLVCVGVAVYAMFQDPHDLAGRLPDQVVNADPAMGADFPDGEWHQYGRTQYGQRYSPLDQITPANVNALELEWTYQTGDVKLPEDVTETTYQVTPLKVGDSLYVCTPHNIAISLDAATGQERWRYDANSGMNPDRQHQTCRGVTYWESPAGATDDGLCARRVYMPTADARLIALDADTGARCTFFADDGELPLEAGMPYNPAGYYYSTSPPVAVDGRIIIGGAVNDNFSIYSQSGVIRAFDIDTGELIWNWDAGNPDQTEPIDIAGGETYSANSPNSWSIFSVDEALGLVYIPLGNQVPDQLGMGRSPAVEEHSSSVVALDVATGQREWVFQTVHHDLWDMDVPAQPVLVDLTQSDGTDIPALVQPTKQGDIYVLDRRTGTPLIDVTEVPAPGGAIPEDFTAPTQPVSALTFMPDPLTGADMWGITMLDQLACRIQLHRLNYEGRYTPPSLNGTIVHPGNFGVFNWGSVAVDPVRQVVFGMPTYLPFTVRLVPRDQIPDPVEGETASEQGLNRNEGAPYGVVMGPFLGPLQVPCAAPPWGYVAGVDLRTGETLWQHKNGTVRDMTPLPLPFELGVPGIGGPIITGGGMAFLGATVDNYLRGYDLTTGDEIWRARLPAGGQSTPMTYEQDGRQYLVMVAGGHGSVGTDPGDYILAYALPE
ncbi:glucose/quinate/shikimate family membrane-bound PQQ-dependent dehydrogenase [Pseudotabrizicola formosa]|uniref:glucose/quinate/shikimate family membrane-bound PQQ-dependent dehydrogenase n=1 Tax=Pseudotabrizicola formosa TaxID=2030009 RepID=UPI000CD29E1C|nr:glucose/quinate/shikimate family membrane-bound PQQ-dependent dehydrogenase [Pseudotabrizicola formosa]